MKSFPVLSLVAAGAVVLAGCSGGGSQRVAGRQCPVNYKSVEMVGQKLWKKGDNESSIPAGTYTYDRADMIYTEKGDEGLVVHVQDTLMKDGTFKASVYCVRNGLSIQGRPVAAASPVASKIVAKAGAGTEALAKELSFRMIDGRLTAESKELVGASAPVSLDKVYEGKAQDYVLIEHANKIDYEVRSTFSDNNGTYDVSVKFKKAP